MYFVEYSPKQKCFHVDDCETLIKGNRARVLELFAVPGTYIPDYIPIGMFEDIEAANDFCHTMRRLGSVRELDELAERIRGGNRNAKTMREND